MIDQDTIDALKARIRMLEQEVADKEASKTTRRRRQSSSPKNWFGVYAPEIQREFIPEEHARFVARRTEEHTAESGYVLGLAARCHRLTSQLRK